MTDRYIDLTSGLLDLKGVQCAFREDRRTAWWRRCWPTLVVGYHGSDDELIFWYRDARIRDDAHSRLVAALNSYPSDERAP